MSRSSHRHVELRAQLFTPVWYTIGTMSIQPSESWSKRRRSGSPPPSVLRPDRLVQFLPQFFDELDGQLPDQLGSDGSPSAADFLLHELTPVGDLLASGFERNTLEVIGAEPLRVLIGSGTLIRVVAIYAYLADDDTVAVIGIKIQPAAGGERRSFD